MKIEVAPVIRHAPAKINLNLHITGRLENGYHELDTLFFALDEPCDVLTFTQGESGTGCSLCCPIPGLAREDNLAFKAYQSFAEATGFAPDLHVHIEKNIPTGAGLGGGSTNAAAVLRYLNEAAREAALSQEELIRLGARLGADVPFFLLDTPARATGIGEKLVPRPVSLAGLTLVLACPEVHVDTAWAYHAYDREKPPVVIPLTTSHSHNTRPAPVAIPLLHNDFERVVFRAFPAIREVKELLLSQGAAGASMSGSGASVFAFFRIATEAENAVQTLAAKGVKAYTRHY